MVLFTQPFVLSVMQNIQVHSTVYWIYRANFLKLSVDWKSTRSDRQLWLPSETQGADPGFWLLPSVCGLCRGLVN